MLKALETSHYPARRTHRTYPREFKAELVAACQQPGASIAALAGAHGMNANVLHRWLKEHAQDGRHTQNTKLVNSDPSSVALPQSPTFIPVQLPARGAAPCSHDIKVEIRKGALTLSIAWPAAASADFASWATSLLK